MGTNSNLATTRHCTGSRTSARRRPGGLAPAGRRLHVVDVENLLGTGRPLPAQLAWGARTYRRLTDVGPDDLVVVASSPFLGVEVGRCWASCRLVVGHGPDGADHALLRVLTDERVDRRFPEVIVASGDGIFTDQVARLQHHHVEVTVVSRATALARRLRLAASSLIEFPPTTPADITALSAA